MARRGTRAGERPIELGAFAETALRIAGAIALDALGFIVWNVGTRPPLALVGDIRRGFRDPRTLFAGTLSALVGFIFVLAATVLVIPAVADPPRDLAAVEVLTFVVALAIEHLIGDDVRGLARYLNG